jgi:hypothetical protein
MVAHAVSTISLLHKATRSFIEKMRLHGIHDPDSGTVVPLWWLRFCVSSSQALFPVK